MTVLDFMWLIAASGLLGGVVNALLSDNGFVMPRREKLDQTTVLRPGVLGNILVSTVAAVLSWGLYGPLATQDITNKAPVTGVTLAALAGAVLVGIAGARWLTSEVDKKVLRATATKAGAVAPTEANKKSLLRVLSVNPFEAFNLTSNLVSLTELVVDVTTTGDITLSLDGEVLEIKNGKARKMLAAGDYTLAWLVQGRGKSYSVKVTSPAYVTCEDNMTATPDEFVNGACPFRII